MSGGTVVVNADELLRQLDKVRRSLDDLSSFLSTGMTTKPPSTERQLRSEKVSQVKPFELKGFDIDAVDWKLKGGSPAGPESPWCWGFSTDRDGVILDEARPLVEAIERYGPEVVVGDYVLTLSGRDGNLLSRRRIKK
jgi:hypothetical protein